MRRIVWSIGLLLAFSSISFAVDYDRDIKTLLRARCVSCHGSVRQEADLRLDAGSLILKGSSHAVVHKGDSGSSELIRRVTSMDEDLRMPPEGARLADDEIELLEQWIDQGAKFPESEIVPRRPAEHWSFQPITPPRLPRVQDSEWCNNSIDAFVLSQLESKGLRPTARAPHESLVRRVFLDLLGIPPTIAEQERFSRVDDIRDLVHELLSRPEYGERWARYWLDIVRYADSNGYERDAEKPFVWRYRDYVISAFNRDKPFDRFIVEQVAGDQLNDRDAESVIATGFHRLGHWDDEPADPVVDRFDQLDDIISTTGQAFLGMTIGCARCHDHKFEPLSSRDYYSLVAVFNSLDRPRDGRKELTIVQDGVDVYAWRENESPVNEAHVLLRGSPGRLGDLVKPAFPAVLSVAGPLEPKPTMNFARPRLAFAEWIADENNPLTARVIVNRVWQQHFGVGLVGTSNDFGLMGAPPSHPELLDWLSDWFMHDAAWSVKKLHALILESRIWQSMKSSSSMVPYRRLEVEAIRDSMLAVSGQLHRIGGGPAMKPAIPRAALEANTDQEKIWKASEADQTSRRSIYAFIKRGLIVPMMETLDLADTVSSCPQRQITTVAPQALSLFNGDFAIQQAEYFAARIRSEAGNDVAKQVHFAWKSALCREPTPRELESMIRFLERESLEQLGRVIFNLNEFVYPE